MCVLAVLWPGETERRQTDGVCVDTAGRAARPVRSRGLASRGGRPRSAQLADVRSFSAYREVRKLKGRDLGPGCGRPGWMHWSGGHAPATRGAF